MCFTKAPNHEMIRYFCAGGGRWRGEELICHINVVSEQRAGSLRLQYPAMGLLNLGTWRHQRAHGIPVELDI